jgi:hypothetical protein
VIYRLGNLWYQKLGPHGVFVVPTNGGVNGRGECIMGRGVAQQAASMNRGLALTLGQIIQSHGNHVWALPSHLVSFPVKEYHLMKADLKLIRRSADELAILAHLFHWNPVYMPAVGCGNGGLTWPEVSPILTEILEESRFVMVVNRPHEGMPTPPPTEESQASLPGQASPTTPTPTTT